MALAEAAKKYGKRELAAMLDNATRDYVSYRLPKFKALRLNGAEALLDVFNMTVEGKADPAVCHIVNPWPSSAKL